MDGRKERVTRIKAVLRVCHKNNWTYDTPNLAGKLESMLAPAGFTRKTTRDYIDAIMEILGPRRRRESELQ